MVYPCVPVPEGGNYRDEQHEGGGPGVFQSVCACGREVSWPCSVSGCPNLDMAHQGLPTLSRRRFMFLFPSFLSLVISASF